MLAFELAGFFLFMKMMLLTYVADQVSDWSRQARDWAVSSGITDGTRPKDAVTREEVWTMLYRMKNAIG